MSACRLRVACAFLDLELARVEVRQYLLRLLQDGVHDIAERVREPHRVDCALEREAECDLDAHAADFAVDLDRVDAELGRLRGVIALAVERRDDIVADDTGTLGVDCAEYAPAVDVIIDARAMKFEPEGDVAMLAHEFVAALHLAPLVCLLVKQRCSICITENKQYYDDIKLNIRQYVAPASFVYEL